MKGRLIGALWIAAALVAALFVEGGFHALIWFCLAMAFAEVYIGTGNHEWRFKEVSKWINRSPVIEVYLILIAAVSLIYLSETEIMIVILVCMLSDVGAFAVGKTVGRHKVEFLKKISPNKSYEGYVGGAVIPFLMFLIIPLVFGIQLNACFVVFVLLGGIVAEIGDLLGSATKRRMNIKDSGEYLSLYDGYRILEYPLKGHGGYLDRIDSLILVTTFYLAIRTMVSLF